jgi:hypothetical protein
MDVVKTISPLQIKKIPFCVIDVLYQSATTEQTEEKDLKTHVILKIFIQVVNDQIFRGYQVFDPSLDCNLPVSEISRRT